MIALSKTLDPHDDLFLAEELTTVDQHFTKASEQHPLRRWEYAMALRAQREWRAVGNPRASFVYDVGGAGSPFSRMVDTGLDLCVIDPDLPPPHNYRLDEYLASPQGATLGQNVFCLSVLEHVADLDQFLYHLGCLTAPGGLLFLTMDCWNKTGPDTAHFHWMRKRIFSAASLTASWFGVAERLDDFSFVPFGAADWTYHGDHVYDYSFASLALVKRS